jgi:hypothetical protein
MPLRRWVTEDVEPKVRQRFVGSSERLGNRAASGQAHPDDSSTQIELDGAIGGGKAALSIRDRGPDRRCVRGLISQVSADARDAPA